MSIHRTWRRGVLPVPTDAESDFDRFYHHDLGGLSALEMFSERVLITEMLSRHVYGRQRDRLIWVGDRQVADRAWLLERLERLSDEERRRRKAAA